MTPIEIKREHGWWCDGYGPTAETCTAVAEYAVSGRKVYSLCARCAARAAKRWRMALPVNVGETTTEAGA